MSGIEKRVDVIPYFRLGYAILDKALFDLECVPEGYKDKPDDCIEYGNTLNFLTHSNQWCEELCDLVNIDFSRIKRRALEIHNNNISLC